MPTEERVTYCRICEPLCGMVATVEDGKLTKLRPDSEHPLSQGFACPKGIAMAEVQNDPDRVLHPLRKNATGEFERVGWDEALDEIGARLRRIVGEHGGDSVGYYMGNPAAFSYSHPLWAKGFVDAFGSPHFYTASSQDVSSRFAASHFLYGSPYIVPIPDLARTDFLLIVGANPLVSHGSVMSAPRVKDQLHAITERDGRVVVVDPRRSETARAFEHVAIHPDGDAFLLLSMLEAIFSDGLEDEEAIARQSRGVAALRDLAMQHPAERTEVHTGVEAREVRRLARDLARAERAAVYGRTGSCLGRNATVVSFLLDALNLVTGNLDREGGAVFGDPPVDFERLASMVNLATYDRVRSRIGDLPEVLGSLPASVMAKEMTTPGKGQIRAFFVSAGNPVLSVPNGAELEEAMAGLELSVAIDLYVSDTSRHCDFVLPATTMYEREDFPLPFLSLFTTPFIQMTDPVVEPAGEARQEWEIIDQISRRAGVVPSSLRLLRWAGKAGMRLSPERLVDLILRAGPGGDWFGLRTRAAQRGRAAPQPARDRARRRPRRGSPARQDPPPRQARAPRPARGAGGRADAGVSKRPRPGLPAAADRTARAALAQLVDAQLAAPDARRSRAHGADPPRGRGGGRHRRGRGVPRLLGARLRRAAREADRRGQTRHGRGTARLGPPRRRLAGGERRRRRQLERPLILGPLRARAARRHGPSERDPDPDRAGGGLEEPCSG